MAVDYPGLGSAMPHTYLGGVSAANAVLDGVRAARGITGASAGNVFATWGESQGGHAALWTADRAALYAPELRLVGAAAAAPPTDLPRNLAEGSDPAVRGFLTAFTAYSWSRHYGASLSTLGNRATAGVITRLARNNCIVLDKKPRLGTILGVLALKRDLRNVELGKTAPWSRYARLNSAPVRDPGVPLLITQNPRDVVVARPVTDAHVRKLCRIGARLRYTQVAGKGHETSAADAATQTLDWIDARFAGQQAVSSCSGI